MSSAIKIAYSASANLTVTNLNSLASSQTWVAGWESDVIDNTSNLYTDILMSGKFTVASSNNQAGQINWYIGTLLDDSTYMDVLDGTESTETFPDTEERDGALVIAKVMAVDTSAGAVIYSGQFSVASLFGGTLPKKFVNFISLNPTTTTTAGLAASGNQVSWVGSYYNVG